MAHRVKQVRFEEGTTSESPAPLEPNLDLAPTARIADLSFPTELLGDILVWTIKFGTPKRTSHSIRTAVSLVCRRWRDILKSHPEGWTTLWIAPNERHGWLKPGSALKWLARSPNKPDNLLSIYIDCSDITDKAVTKKSQRGRIASIIATYVKRWESLIVYDVSPSDFSRTLQWACEGKPAPNLEVLRIGFDPLSNTDGRTLNGYPHPTDPNYNIAHACNKPMVTLSSSIRHLEVPRPALIIQTPPIFSHLVSLTLLDNICNKKGDPSWLMDALSQCTNLQTLGLRCSHAEPASWTQLRPSTTLPQLRELELHGNVLFCRAAQRIRCPKLAVLTLRDMRAEVVTRSKKILSDLATHCPRLHTVAIQGVPSPPFKMVFDTFPQIANWRLVQYSKKTITALLEIVEDRVQREEKVELKHLDLVRCTNEEGEEMLVGSTFLMDYESGLRDLRIVMDGLLVYDSFRRRMGGGWTGY